MVLIILWLGELVSLATRSSFLAIATLAICVGLAEYRHYWDEHRIQQLERSLNLNGRQSIDEL